LKASHGIEPISVSLPTAAIEFAPQQILQQRIWLVSYGRKYYSLIYYEKKILLNG